MKKIIVFLMFILLLFAAGCQESSIQNSGTANTQTVNTSNQAKQTVSEQTVNTSGQVKNSGSSEVKNASAAQAGTAKQEKENKVQPSKSESVKPQVKANVPSTFTLTVSENDGSETLVSRKIAISGGESSMDYLRSLADVMDDGGFIKSINGIASVPASQLSSQQKSAGILGMDWFIFVNGKKAAVGADDIIPKAGDTINFDFKAWTYKDLAQ